MSTDTTKLSNDGKITITAPASSRPTIEAIATGERSSWVNWAIWGVVALLVLLYPFFAGKLWVIIATQGAILAIGALGLNVLTGYTGLASLGHAFFLGVGAYAAAYFGGNLGWSFLLWLPLAGVVAGTVGLLIGGLTLRFRGLYLTIVTLGLAFIGGHVFLNLKDISGGVSGRAFPSPTIGNFTWAESVSKVGPFDLTRDQKFYFLVIPILVLLIIFVSNAMRTRMGRAFQAVRDREVAAELMGIDAARTKIISFTFSAVLGGICGALYASYLRQVQPDFWGLDLSIQFVAMIIIGGIASVNGSVLGALLLTALPEIISENAEKIPFVQTGAGSGGITSSDLSEIIYALFLALFLVFQPTGLAGLLRRVVSKVKSH